VGEGGAAVKYKFICQIEDGRTSEQYEKYADDAAAAHVRYIEWMNNAYPVGAGERSVTVRVECGAVVRYFAVDGEPRPHYSAREISAPSKEVQP